MKRALGMVTIKIKQTVKRRKQKLRRELISHILVWVRLRILTGLTTTYTNWCNWIIKQACALSVFFSEKYVISRKYTAYNLNDIGYEIGIKWNGLTKYLCNLHSLTSLARCLYLYLLQDTFYLVFFIFFLFWNQHIDDRPLTESTQKVNIIIMVGT